MAGRDKRIVNKVIQKIQKGNVGESFLDNVEEIIKYRGFPLKRRHRELISQKRRLQYYKRLKREIYDAIENDCRESAESTDCSYEKIVWICWLQGIENAPLIVKACVESVRKWLCDELGWQMVVISKENISSYIDFPKYIWEKYESGIISNAHFSDLIRLELLLKYGGLWIDSTVFFSGNDFMDFVVNTPVFAPSKWIFFNGEIMEYDNWFIFSYKNNQQIRMVRACLLEYWKKYNFALDYFLFHLFFTMAMRGINIPYCSVHACEWLGNHFFDQYNPNIYLSVLYQSQIHKLTYRYSETDMLKEGTFFEHWKEQNMKCFMPEWREE